MGLETGIAWTDSTWNPWIGCTKVGPACDHCYAESFDKREGKGVAPHWGKGAPRRKTKTLTDPIAWNKRAGHFVQKRGHPQRVFVLSLGDWADKEIDPGWRAEMWDVIGATPDLRYQLCTKRVSNIGRYLPKDWDPVRYSHVGFLITCVLQSEARRDIPRLLSHKFKHGLRWVGISYEPALGPIDFSPWTSTPMGFRGALDRALGEISPAEADRAFFQFMKDRGTAVPEKLDWIIAGGESGKQARDDDADWYRKVRDTCRVCNVPFFMKQMAHLAAIPDDLNIRQFPEALCV